MESAGMMKMATSEGSPLRQGAGIGSRLGFHGYTGLQRWNYQSLFCSGSLGIYKRCLRREQVGGSTRQPQDRRRAQGVGRSLHPRGRLGTLLAQLFYFGGFFWSIKNHQKLAHQLDSVWYSLSVELKTRKKTETGTGLEVNRLVPKII